VLVLGTVIASTVALAPFASLAGPASAAPSQPSVVHVPTPPPPQPAVALRAAPAPSVQSAPATAAHWTVILLGSGVLSAQRPSASSVHLGSTFCAPPLPGLLGTGTSGCGGRCNSHGTMTMCPLRAALPMCCGVVEPLDHR
jgi:hypothetical protein